MNVRGDTSRQSIMARSKALFAARGIDSVSIRDIGVAAGLTNPALFRHFASKEALATELFAASYRRLVTVLQQAAATDGFNSWLAAALAEVAAEPDDVLYVTDNLRRYFATLPPDLRTETLPKLVREMIVREQAAGRFRPDIDLSLAVTLILGALSQTARSIHFRDATIDIASHTGHLARLLTQGLGYPETRA